MPDATEMASGVKKKNFAINEGDEFCVTVKSRLLNIKAYQIYMLYLISHKKGKFLSFMGTLLVKKSSVDTLVLN